MSKYDHDLNYLRDICGDIVNGHNISFEEAMHIVEKYSADTMIEYTGQIRSYFKKNKGELCSVLNARSGACSENCKFCAQSAHYKTEIKIYGLLDKEHVLNFAEYCVSKGIKKFSLVTSGRKLEPLVFKEVLDIYGSLSRYKHFHICASHGELSLEMAKALKDQGVKTYHHNLETSSSFFKHICTTHSYEDRISTIKNCIQAGLAVCSGGIIGMGEKREDRINMFIQLRELGIKSIPINILTPIKGTPFEDMEPLKDDEITKMYCICRLINPQSTIRFAGGRSILARDIQLQLLKSVVDAAITGDLLTTCGISVEDDKKLFRDAGLSV